MNYQWKVVLISFAAAVLLSVLFTVLGGGFHTANDFVFGFGMLAFWGGLLQMIVGLFLLLLTDKKHAQGCLLAGGLLMLLGFVVCTSSFKL